jgi:hypothetical protein
VLIDFDGRSDTRSIATAALGCQAAIAGYCAAAFFLSQAFSWLFYLVIIPSLALSLFLVGAKQRTDLFR